MKRRDLYGVSTASSSDLSLSSSSSLPSSSSIPSVRRGLRRSSSSSSCVTTSSSFLSSPSTSHTDRSGKESEKDKTETVEILSISSSEREEAEDSSRGGGGRVSHDEDDPSIRLPRGFYWRLLHEKRKKEEERKRNEKEEEEKRALIEAYMNSLHLHTNNTSQDKRKGQNSNPSSSPSPCSPPLPSSCSPSRLGVSSSLSFKREEKTEEEKGEGNLEKMKKNDEEEKEKKEKQKREGDVHVSSSSSDKNGVVALKTKAKCVSSLAQSDGETKRKKKGRIDEGETEKRKKRKGVVRSFHSSKEGDSHVDKAMKRSPGKDPRNNSHVHSRERGRRREDSLHLRHLSSASSSSSRRRRHPKHYGRLHVYHGDFLEIQWRSPPPSRLSSSFSLSSERRREETEETDVKDSLPSAPHHRDSKRGVHPNSVKKNSNKEKKKKKSKQTDNSGKRGESAEKRDVKMRGERLLDKEGMTRSANKKHNPNHSRRRSREDERRRKEKKKKKPRTRGSSSFSSSSSSSSSLGSDEETGEESDVVLKKKERSGHRQITSDKEEEEDRKKKEKEKEKKNREVDGLSERRCEELIEEVQSHLDVVRFLEEKTSPNFSLIRNVLLASQPPSSSPDTISSLSPLRRLSPLSSSSSSFASSPSSALFLTQEKEDTPERRRRERTDGRAAHLSSSSSPLHLPPQKEGEREDSVTKRRGVAQTPEEKERYRLRASSTSSLRLHRGEKKEDRAFFNNRKDKSPLKNGKKMNNDRNTLPSSLSSSACKADIRKVPSRELLRDERNPQNITSNNVDVRLHGVSQRIFHCLQSVPFFPSFSSSSFASSSSFLPPSVPLNPYSCLSHSSQWHQTPSPSPSFSPCSLTIEGENEKEQERHRRCYEFSWRNTLPQRERGGGFGREEDKEEGKYFCRSMKKESMVWSPTDLSPYIYEIWRTVPPSQVQEEAKKMKEEERNSFDTRGEEKEDNSPYCLSREISNVISSSSSSSSPFPYSFSSPNTIHMNGRSEAEEEEERMLTHTGEMNGDVEMREETFIPSQSEDSSSAIMREDQPPRDSRLVKEKEFVTVQTVGRVPPLLLSLRRNDEERIDTGGDLEVLTPRGLFSEYKPNAKLRYHGVRSSNASGVEENGKSQEGRRRDRGKETGVDSMKSLQDKITLLFSSPMAPSLAEGEGEGNISVQRRGGEKEEESIDKIKRYEREILMRQFFQKSHPGMYLSSSCDGGETMKMWRQLLLGVSLLRRKTQRFPPENAEGVRMKEEEVLARLFEEVQVLLLQREGEEKKSEKTNVKTKTNTEREQEKEESDEAKKMKKEKLGCPSRDQEMKREEKRSFSFHEERFLLGTQPQEKEERHKREESSLRDDLLSSFPRPFANSQRLLRTKLRSLHNLARDEHLAALRLRKKKIECEEENKATVGDVSRRGEEEEERKKEEEEEQEEPTERLQRKREREKLKASAFLSSVTDAVRGEVLHDQEEERNERGRVLRVKGKREEEEREHEREDSRKAREKKDEILHNETKGRKEEKEAKNSPRSSSKASPEEIPGRTHKTDSHQETCLLSPREEEEVKSLSKREKDRENGLLERRRGRERRGRKSSGAVRRSPSPREGHLASVNIKIELAATGGERLLLLDKDTLQKTEEGGGNKGEKTEKEGRRTDDRERASSLSSSSPPLSCESKIEGKKEEEEEAKETLDVHRNTQVSHCSPSSSSVQLLSGGEKDRSPSLYDEAVDEKRRRKREKAKEEREVEEEMKKKDRSLLLLLDVEGRDIGYYYDDGEYGEETEKREEEKEAFFFDRKNFDSYSVENSLGASHHQQRWRRERAEEEKERRERRRSGWVSRRTGGGRENRWSERYERNDDSSSSPWKRLFNFSWLTDDFLLEDEQEDEEEKKKEQEK
ncbi:hypothetical protein CSUI_002835 [Cystoisospora suis]|uniref:Uncharacterized protein n=1 Tax=Cystoisospora suis TaxID=483139 RepID=A0A2C6L794_9APIC|nr:hypothetical protein CSUI_002835 [Cystoisospora suis]